MTLRNDASSDATTSAHHGPPEPASPAGRSEHDGLEMHAYVITGATVLGLAMALVVGAASFTQSFSALLDLSVMAGTDPGNAWVTPVALDGPILAAGVIRIALSQHTDRATVLGRRFVVAVLAVTGVLSMAGNAYHTVIAGHGVLDAAVSASIGALASAMVIIMSEVVSVILRAPRRRRPPPDTGRRDTVTAEKVSEATVVGEGAADESSTLETLVDEHGRLADDVWVTVDLYHNDPTARANFSEVARRLGRSTSTVTRRYDKVLELVGSIAASKVAATQQKEQALPLSSDADPPPLRHTDHAVQLVGLEP